MRTQSSLLVILLLLCGTAFVARLAMAQPTNPGAGGWQRIKDVDENYHVMGIAEFAVSEHNQQTGLDLKFVRIIRGYVNGTYYRLVIQANDGTNKHSYEALVWEKLWDKIRELISFKLLS